MDSVRGKIINNGITIGKIFFYSKEMGPSKFTEVKEPSIIVSKELKPNETIQFGKLSVVAFVIKCGSSNSHTSILARTMNLPAITDIEIKEEWHNKTAIVDGYNGIVIIEPGEETLLFYGKKKEEEDEKKRLLLNAYKGRKTQTKSGKRVYIYANITKPSDIQNVIANDAEGIGVFKSEFLYLESSDFPTEEEQLNAYKEIVTLMDGKKVVIRTLDIGADKTVDYFNLDKEENPAMGYRAIRICLDQPNIFVTQLRAILRASAFGNVSVMYPMIISVDEVVKIKEVVTKVMNELKQEKIPFNENIEQGIMIETPASVIMSEELAQIVDFFSIGTNDLTQYTLAIDRQNPKLESISNSYHPAILRSIKFVAENAHKAGIWVGISGELGADTTLTKTFIEYGIDALAVSPSKILKIRKTICDMD